jgi:hypothetical protein
MTFKNRYANSSPNIIRAIKDRMIQPNMQDVGDGTSNNSHVILIGKPGTKKPKYRWGGYYTRPTTNLM